MSAFNIKSKVIANRDAAPPVLTDAVVGTGSVFESIGTENLPTTADIGSQVRLVIVPSSARISSLDYFNTQLGTSALDVAVWFPTAVPVQSSVVGARLISSSAFAANIAGVDTGAIGDGLGTILQLTPQERAQPLWQACGMTSDPLLNLDIGFTVRTTNTIGGYVGLRARFVR